MAGDDRRLRAEDRPTAPDLHRRAEPGVQADRTAFLSWLLTIREGPRIRRQRFAEADEALGALEREGRGLARRASRAPVDIKVRHFDPVQLIEARLELAGPQRLLPSTRAGIDIRGDGSSEAFLGRVRRRVVAQRGGEDAFAALRRELTARGSRR